MRIKVNTPLFMMRNCLEYTSRLAERLGVSFATVNGWEGGIAKPQRAAAAAIVALSGEAGIEDDATGTPAPLHKRRRPLHKRRRGAGASAPTTKPMEQMLWDAACSIRGEKDAPKFKDYLLPLLFLKRLPLELDRRGSNLGRLPGELCFELVG